MRNLKGRGAEVNPNNQFLNQQYDDDAEYFEHLHQTGEKISALRTEIIKVYPKTIVNKVPSPDIGFEYSMNPYQGCEHGCIYCYARNSHEFWGYSAGLDFESKLLVKPNSLNLLEKKLNSRSWKPKPIMLSGNTDCYQPIERKFELTRDLLKLMLACKHPVGIITKNALILRDLEILRQLADLNLVQVVLSITTLDNDLRRIMEPRTSSIEQKLKAIRKLSNNGIPVIVMMAPIIPSINNQEIMRMAEKVADNGAFALRYTTVRLNGILPVIFGNWLDKHFPDRKDKVLNQISELHGGKLSDSRFGTRMKGEGEYAMSISKMFKMACKKYDLNKKSIQLNTRLFRKPSDKQFDLFK
ncbi:MAG: PA0069 family radical SAM protein [Reichenbachiella sp.]